MKLAQAALAHCREGWYAVPELIPLKVRALIAAADTLSPGEALGCLFYALGLAQTYYLQHLAAFITLHIANIQVRKLIILVKEGLQIIQIDFLFFVVLFFIAIGVNLILSFFLSFSFS